MIIRKRARVVWQAASVTLSYPDPAVIAKVQLVADALAEAAPDAAPHFAPVLQAWRSQPVAVLQTSYVDTFDLSRKHALYLSYWTDGDTRRRGQVLTTFKQRYRSSDFLVNTRGELPDFLPLVLEYAAVADPVAGCALLQEYRASLDLLRLALLDRGSPYAGVLTAVCGTLPGPTPSDRRQVMERARAGPPTESVGLDPYIAPREGLGSLRSRSFDDPRLLPMHEPMHEPSHGRS